MNSKPRAILHVDMDAFYASVEIRDNPELRGLPVVVGGSPKGRGVVSAASYEARKFGLHSAMPSRTAKRLCPQVLFIRPRHDYYSAISKQIHGIFARYTPLIEPLSLDEAFLDVTHSQRLWGSAETIGRRIKSEIANELGLIASAGVAPNKFLAKLASDLEKPDGFVVVNPECVEEFLDPLPVSRIWGVGKAGRAQLAAMGVRQIGELRKLPIKLIVDRFGEWGNHIWQLAHGRDERPVVRDREAKSISHETTFDHDISNLDILHDFLLELTEQVGRRLRQSGRQAHSVEVKIRFADFKTITRSQRLPSASDITGEIWRVAEQLLIKELAGKNVAIRLLGVGVADLAMDADQQLTLFGNTVSQGAELDKISDQIKTRFGEQAIHRGLNRKSTEKK